MLNVDAVVRDKRATFDVKVKSPFSVSGEVGLPPDDDYRLKGPRRTLAFSPGEEQDLTFRWEPIDLDQKPRWPQWWHQRSKRSPHGRLGVFQFVRLQLNSM